MPLTNGLVLVTDDDPQMRRLVARALQKSGYEVQTCENGEACLAALSATLPEAVCLDLDMPGLGGLKTLRQIRVRHRLLPVVILTADSAVDSVVAAMQEGAYDYLVKPIDFTALMTRIRNAVDRSRMSVRLLELERETKDGGYRGIVAGSPVMRKLFGKMDRVTASDATVLIYGESGTGKEMVARTIHREGGRAAGPFVAVNCAAIADTLEESELFGHEKGAFTGAIEKRKGRIEQADQGTLFLDEIGELSLSLQAKLLRVIQERSFHRIGGTAETTSDFRLVAATHRDLRAQVARGAFREDLYFRIAVLDLHVPPLRERAGDVALLSRHFLDEHERRSGTKLRLSREALSLLESFDWPGNVRQLANVIQKTTVFSEATDVLGEDDLPDEVRQNGHRPPSPVAAETELASVRPSQPEPDHDGRNGQRDAFKLDELERIAILDALQEANGSVPEASRLLGISRPTLYRKLKKYRLR